jgi:hypothetical protein
MKELSTTILRSFVRVLGVVALFACATAGPAAPGQSPPLKTKVEPLRIQTFAFWGNTITGSDKATVAIVLNRPAPAGGVIIKLSSGNQAVLPMPTGVTVEAGKNSHSFQVDTSPVASVTLITVKAQLGDTSVYTATLTVLPPALLLLDCRPLTLRAQETTTCTVWLTGKVAQGQTVGISPISTDNTSAAWLAVDRITIGEGKKTGTFEAKARFVPQQTSARISAAYAGATKSFPITVLPSSIKSFSISPYEWNPNSGSPSQIMGSLALFAKAFPDPVTIRISSDYKYVAPETYPPLHEFTLFPKEVTIPAGSDTVTFTGQPKAVPEDMEVKVSAFLKATGETMERTYKLHAPRLADARLSFSTPCTGGSVRLASAAPAGGAKVNLSFGRTSGPSHVTIPGGDTSKHFNIGTCEAPYCSVTATYRGITKQGRCPQ